MRKLKNKQEALHYFIVYFIGFIAFGIIIPIVKITNNPYANFDMGVLNGFILGILLVMCLFFMAQYEKLKEKEKENEKRE
ncbi:MAG: hypothetical protein ACFFDH_09455 [Promethearchaeota archaeon]